jgi:hypothetical protein
MALPSANGGASRALGLKILRVQGKGGRTDIGSGPGRPAWADQPRPTSARFGRPLRSRGSSCIYALCPFHLHDLTMSSSRPRWRFSVHEVRSLRFNLWGCSFGTLWSSPPLEVISSGSWTRIRLRKCSYELVANPSFMSMFSYINTTIPNVCTKMNLLYD